MKYGDFSSLVQLGVGLHIGTALLQLYGEFGAEPLVRTLNRVKAMLPESTDNDERSVTLREDYEHLAADYEIFKIRLFQSYKRYLLVNSVAAILLTAVLTVIAFKADDPISGYWESITIPIVGLSVFPAVLTLGSLWFDASKEVKPMKNRADKLEGEVLRFKPSV